MNLIVTNQALEQTVQTTPCRQKPTCGIKATGFFFLKLPLPSNASPLQASTCYYIFWYDLKKNAALGQRPSIRNVSLDLSSPRRSWSGSLVIKNWAGFTGQVGVSISPSGSREKKLRPTHALCWMGVAVLQVTLTLHEVVVMTWASISSWVCLIGEEAAAPAQWRRWHWLRCG